MLSEVWEMVAQSGGPEKHPEDMNSVSFHVHVKAGSGRKRASMRSIVSRGLRVLVYSNLQKGETIN